ncbi:hypothetical protein M0R04_13840 [Candidatus Dojkabacteria bacterium]|jgi:hypothetical protein|nr:hypothetical protein [Candidatus Dojkabacteria bacterium]
MSLSFTNIVSLINSNTKANATSYPIAEKVIDVNLAMDKVFEIIFQNSGKWQFDDSNHTDYPFIMTSLVSGQRDYTFTTDEQGNLILDIYKVMIKTGTGATDYYVELPPVDQQSADYTSGFWSGQNLTSIPSRYDKTANGIFLDAIPNYSVTNGLKIFINREGSYFTVNDTTKKPGFAGLFHEYLALFASYQYARRNGLKNQEVFKRDMLEMENQIEVYYSQRSRDEKQQIITKHRSPR